ncbi:MAG: response regulator transcription factor [Bacteroidetes bacterium]|nr:response regulator transcription factor [Bacteroidota bacterium]MBS1747201.1 response regulator transcription factor [Bacteroidota bacterium]
MIKCIIIEDEPQAVKTLSLMMAEYYPDILVAANFDKVSTAAEFIKSELPDFVFLDVQLNGEIGLDLINHLSKEELNFEIIFTTAYSGYALEAFTLSAIDYILKPIDAVRMREAVARVLKKKSIGLEQLQILQQISTVNTIERIVLKNTEGKHFIYTKDIIYLKANNVYTEFYVRSRQKIVVSKPMKDYEILLQQNDFFKTHRSYIINIKNVKTYHPTTLEIELVNGSVISLSRDKKKDFEERMKA